MTRGNTILRERPIKQTYVVHLIKRDQKVIAHEGEVVVGLKERRLWSWKREGCGVDKNASEARGMARGKLV